MTYATKPLQRFVDYFGCEGGNPVIVQHYVPGTGWKRAAWRKRASRSWLIKLRREGITWVSVEHAGRVADFTIQEVLRNRWGVQRAER